MEAELSDSEGVVRYETAGPVATITFDRPSARNAMTWSMYDQLSASLDRIDNDPSVRVALLRGSGERFIAGTDIAQFTSFETADDGVGYEHRLDGIIGRLASVRVPTIAAIDGAAAGGGLLIAATCDIRICTPHARFGAPIARTVGNCLSMASTARLIAVLGVSRVMAMLLLADFMGAEEALIAGFVAEVVDRKDIEQRSRDLCERVAAHAPITIKVMRESAARVVGAMDNGADDLVRLAYGSDDFKEGVRAFLEKRTPNWTGR